MSRRRSRGRKSVRVANEPPAGPPTVISLSWDYGYWSILEDVSPGVARVALLDPVELGLSPGLVGRLGAWIEQQESLSRRWLAEEPETDYSRRDEAKSSQDFLTLAYDVQHEMGFDADVLMHGRPLDERRRR